jgi:hypothetical protein
VGAGSLLKSVQAEPHLVLDLGVFRISDFRISVAQLAKAEQIF